MSEADQTQPSPHPQRRRGWPVVVAVVVVLVVLGLVAYLSGWFVAEREQRQPKPSAAAPSPNTDVDFDPASASFFLPPDNRPYYLYGDRYPFTLKDRQPASKPVQFVDGAYYPDEDGADDDPHMRFAEDTEPLYTDVNGDGETDVVAVLEFTGTPDKRFTAWRGVFIWVWKDGQLRPIEHPAAWQWQGCPGETELTVAPDGLSRLPVITATGDGNCDGDDDNSRGENPPPRTVYVKDGVALSVGHATGALDRCYFVGMYKKDADYVVETDVTPRVAPKRGAAAIDGTVLTPQAGGKVRKASGKQTIERVELRIGPKPDKKLYGGWIPASIVWSGEDEPISCGWVNWSDIGKKIDKG